MGLSETLDQLAVATVLWWSLLMALCHVLDETLAVATVGIVDHV